MKLIIYGELLIIIIMGYVMIYYPNERDVPVKVTEMAPPTIITNMVVHIQTQLVEQSPAPPPPPPPPPPPAFSPPDLVPNEANHHSDAP
jgi:hypothetical protein